MGMGARWCERWETAKREAEDKQAKQAAVGASHVHWDLGHARNGKTRITCGWKGSKVDRRQAGRAEQCEKTG
jgi:hypothetical protein